MDLNQLRNLSPDWNIDGRAAPNEVAILNANKVIEAINRNNQIEYIKPSVEEGVFISYKNGNFGVLIECYNDGKIAYVLTHYDKPIVARDSDDIDKQ